MATIARPRAASLGAGERGGDRIANDGIGPERILGLRGHGRRDRRDGCQKRSSKHAHHTAKLRAAAPDFPEAAAFHRHTRVMSWFLSGNERMRLPVARANAFSTAGAATQIVGSPTPPQNPPLGMMIDSTGGICAMRIEL